MLSGSIGDVSDMARGGNNICLIKPRRDLCLTSNISYVSGPFIRSRATQGPSAAVDLGDLTGSVMLTKGGSPSNSFFGGFRDNMLSQSCWFRQCYCLI